MVSKPAAEATWDAQPAPPDVKTLPLPLLKKKAPLGLAVGPLDVVSALGNFPHIESLGEATADAKRNTQKTLSMLKSKYYPPSVPFSVE